MRGDFCLGSREFVDACDVEFVLIETEERLLSCEKDAWTLAFDQSAHGYLLGVLSPWFRSSSFIRTIQ